MERYRRHLLSCFTAVMMGLGSSVPSAQSPVEIVGRWEGVLEAPGVSLVIQLDVVRLDSGPLQAAISIPAENIAGLPLARLEVADGSVIFALGTDPVDRVFRGTLSADRTSLVGKLTRERTEWPVTLRRTGEARLHPPAPSPSLPIDLTGVWNGTLAVDGTSKQLVLVLTNTMNGTSTGTLSSADDGVTVPLTELHGRSGSLTFHAPSVNGRYEGSLSPDRTELAGTWTQQDYSTAVRFTRAPAKR